MQQTELKTILEAHLAWLRGTGGSRADLSGANLSRANLNRANLSRANLSRANLYRANLSRADLRGANLSEADLSGANLYRADLRGADLRGADLSEADLSGADLGGANGFDPNEYRHVFWQIPEVGSFHCFKKLAGGIIAELRVPAGAQRVCNLMNPRKFRVQYAEVVALSEGVVGVALRDNSFVYKVGETVRPDSFDDSMLVDCSNGIHAFLTRQEAEAWNG